LLNKKEKTIATENARKNIVSIKNASAARKQAKRRDLENNKKSTRKTNILTWL